MGPEVFGPDATAFGAQRLATELLIADQEIGYARTWVRRHQWMMYRERVASWRYRITRGVSVYNVIRCHRCGRLVRYQYNHRTYCFACNTRWWVFLPRNAPRAVRLDRAL